MIKNVVFDLGKVLITYDPYAYIESLGYTGERLEALFKTIFLNKIWPEVDRGTYNFEEAIGIFKSESPEYSEDIYKVLAPGWFSILKPIEDTVKFLLELKTAGYKIYLLSNFSAEGFAYIEEKYDFFRSTDGKIISSHVHYIKPEKEIYEILLNKYSLLPDETVFIDDLPENLEGAAKLGIRGILFENTAKLRENFQMLCNF